MSEQMPERIWAREIDEKNNTRRWHPYNHGSGMYPTTAYVRADLVINQGATRVCELQDERDAAQVQIDIGNEALETTLTQRDAALEQLATAQAQSSKLAEALRAWVKWVEDNDDHVNAMCQMSQVHGLNYQGTTWDHALDLARAALKEVEHE